MSRGAALAGALQLMATLMSAQPAPSELLQIYVVDTEGGKAALFISPSGETALVDTGSPGERDTGRIMAAIDDAGVKQIDYLISTHYHRDHIGGLQELAKRIPIAHFIDHGPSVEEREHVPGFQAAYAELHAKAKRTVVRPGDRVPVAGLDWHIVTAGGKSLKTPLPGGGKPNPACAGFAPKEITNDPENGQSVGSVVTFGQFGLIDLGDLLWNNERDLMCPNNPIGTVDLYMVSHHGVDQSGSPVLVHGVQPRVAVMQNGTRKGAGAQAMPTMRSSPGLEDIWQLHWSHGRGIEQNSAGVFIANIDDAATIANVLNPPPSSGQAAVPGQGSGRGTPAPPHAPAYWIKVSAQQDGTFTVLNSRNGFSKTYVPRRSR
jgi:beta-lactamase superfamily II metal-dependent hydrolase